MTTDHAVDASLAVSTDGLPTATSRYELREQLQTSVTGATWRAYDHSAERLVDIRQLRPPAQLALEQRRAMVARWARAALRAQRSQFMGVVQVHDVLASDDELLVVTDVVDAPAVSDLLRTEGSVPTDRASAVAAAIASVLDGLHAKNLVHGDLRPSRIRLADNSLWLITHGLISPDDDDPMPTLLTSPAYLSPQRARGARASTADDIWSLGVLVHAMVEGRPPFVGHSVDEVVDAIVSSPAPRCTSCSPELADLVEAMLDKDPTRRPTAAQVMAKLMPPEVAQPETAHQEAAPPEAGHREAAPPEAAPLVPAPTEQKRKTGSMDYVVPLIGILVLLIVTAILLSRL